MKYFIHFILLFQVVALSAQTITFGDQTDLYLGDGTIFFFGGNTSLKGPVNNSGTIVSYSDLDFTTNRNVGNIKFNGVLDQELSGDTLDVGNFIVDKQGRLNLLTDQVIVSGGLETINGVVDAAEEELLVSGSFPSGGDGYVDGKLLGISRGNPVTFPMGVNGAPNYMTISNLPSGSIVSVECKVPIQNELLPDEDMVGISDEVEWILKVSGDSVEAQVSVNFSGVDLQNLSNGEPIRSLAYEPAIVIFSKEDTLYHALSGAVTNADANFSSGTINSTDNIWINDSGRRLGIALIPIIVEPTFFIPKAFAPKALQEDNRIFRAYFAGALVSSISIKVYDSFNKEVYSLNDSGSELDISQYGWNGVLSSGLDAPEGVYYYQVRIVAESQEYSKTGSVLLVK
ncbi:MAG: hypothetical protein ABJG47_18235 [Ekhidna sp.]